MSPQNPDNRLDEMFRTLKAKGEAAFMPFLVLGDPDFDTSLRLAEALVRAEADVLEFGFAFSDPPADGPVIQAADRRALRGDMTTERGFELLAAVRQRTEAPFVLLMYYNLILQHGVRAFVRRARDVGVDALLVADLPIEEAGELVAVATDAGIAPVFIVSELTSPARLERILTVARGFLYVVAHLGVTGDRATLQSQTADTLTRLRSSCELPLLAGFGLSKPEHVRRVITAGADGAIVGSALIRQIEAHLGNPEEMVASVEALARSLKAATRPS